MTGTDPQVLGPINATYGVTAGATYNAIFHMTDHGHPEQLRPLPADPDHRAAGQRRERRSTRARRWAATPRRTRSSRTWSSRALAPALPERVAAAEGGTACNFLFGGLHPEDGRLLRQLPPRGRRLGREVATTTATTRSSSRTATAATHRSRSSRRATRCAVLEYSLINDSGGAGTDARRARHAPHPPRRAGRRGDVSMRSSTARSRASAPTGSTAAAQGARSRDPREACGRRGVPDVLGGLRHGLPLEVHEHRPHGGRRGAASRRPAGAATATRASATAPAWPRTSSRASSRRVRLVTSTA